MQYGELAITGSQSAPAYVYLSEPVDDASVSRRIHEYVGKAQNQNHAKLKHYYEPSGVGSVGCKWKQVNGYRYN